MDIVLAYRTSFRMLLFGLLAFSCANGFANETLETDNFLLQKTHNQVLKKFDDVNHLAPSKLLEMDSNNFIVFDVRENAEFKVSHLKNAIHVSPSMDISTFINTYQDQFQDKSLVFYCSVGMRSSIFAQKVQSHRNLTASAKIYNLTGGIFNWHNHGLPLFQNERPTDIVHPYGFFWKRLINRKELTSYGKKP